MAGRVLIMEIERPTAIIGMARSGTSMIAGLFCAHGAWLGDSDGPRKLNPRGHFVNNAIGQVLAGGGDPNFIRAEVRKIMEVQGYSGGPWIVKHSPSISHINSLRAFSPRWLFVRRKAIDVFNSRLNSQIVKHGKIINPMSFDSFLKYYRRSTARMDLFKAEFGGHDIWPQSIHDGLHSRLEALLELSGLGFSPEKTQSFLLPEYWRSWEE